MLTSALRALAPAPVAAICAYRFVSLGLYTRSWRRLLPPGSRPPFFALLRLRWIGESINALFPVAQVGGDVARARLVAKRGVPPADAAASLVVDLGIGVVTQVIFSAAAVLALSRIRPGGDHGAHMAALALGGAGASAAALAVIAFLGRGGVSAVMRLVARRPRGRWARFAGSVERLEQALASLLARGPDVAGAFGWHLLGWASHAGETWLFFALSKTPVSPGAALAIEGVVAATRGAAFFVPAGLGVQELTIVSLSSWVGLGTAEAVALGVAKRLRELAVGLPGILLWLFAERSAARPEAPDA